MVRSTIQRFGSTTNLPASERLTISTLTCWQTRPSPAWNFGPLAAVGVEPEQERKQPEQRAHQQHAAVAILNVGGMHDGLHQQALRIDENVALLALGLLPGIETMRVRDPPFSALLTLWLSMIAADGLASRPACSRHWT